jgi:hypothetical protein
VPARVLYTAFIGRPLFRLYKTAAAAGWNLYAAANTFRPSEKINGVTSMMSLLFRSYPVRLLLAIVAPIAAAEITFHLLTWMSSGR